MILGLLCSKEDNLICVTCQKYIENIGLIRRFAGHNDIDITVLLPPSEDRNAIVKVSFYV